jgi:hypothetical protein
MFFKYYFLSVPFGLETCFRDLEVSRAFLESTSLKYINQSALANLGQCW